MEVNGLSVRSGAFRNVHGHDLDTDISPIAAGLDFAVGWEKDFIGKEALLQRRAAGEHCRLVTVNLDDVGAVPLGGEPVLIDGRVAGRTTSAGFGYRVGRPLAIASLADDAALREGARVSLDIAGTRLHGWVGLEAAYDPGGSRMRTL